MAPIGAIIYAPRSDHYHHAYCGSLVRLRSRRQDLHLESSIVASDTSALRSGNVTFSYLKSAKVTYMPLYLVGENIDKTRGFRQAEAGKLVQPMRGIYVDADDDIDQTVRIWRF